MGRLGEAKEATVNASPVLRLLKLRRLTRSLRAVRRDWIGKNASVVRLPLQSFKWMVLTLAPDLSHLRHVLANSCAVRQLTRKEQNKQIEMPLDRMSTLNARFFYPNFRLVSELKMKCPNKRPRTTIIRKFCPAEKAGKCLHSENVE